MSIAKLAEAERARLDATLPEWTLETAKHQIGEDRKSTV